MIAPSAGTMSLLQDCRFALRTLRRRPAFTTVAVITLGLGIGATTAIFSVVDAVLLRPLPFRDSGSLVAVVRTYPHWRNDDILRASWDAIAFSYPKFSEWRAAQTSFTDAGAWGTWITTISDGERAVQLTGVRASPSLLPLLRVQPLLGRTFLPEEGLPSAPKVAILSFETWASRFGGDRHIMGRSVRFDDTPYTIIGVLPARVNLTGRGDPPAVWIAAGVLPQDQPANNNQFRVVARLKGGVTLRQAALETERLVRGDEDPSKLGARIAPWHREQMKTARTPLLILLGAAGLLLAIACGNVAMLLLGESASREHEMASRLALGAGHWRLLRQLVTESVVLACAGWRVRHRARVRRHEGAGRPRSASDPPTPRGDDGPSRDGHCSDRRDDDRSAVRPCTSAVARHHLTRRDAQRPVAFREPAPWSHAARRRRRRARALSHVARRGRPSRAEPERADGGRSRLPGRRADRDEGEHAAVAVPGHDPHAGVLRDRHRTDRGAARTIIINATLAHRGWPNESAVGKRIRYDDDWHTVVGVVGDIRNAGLAVDPQAMFYISALQHQWASQRFVIRGGVRAETLGPSVRQVIASIDPSVPVTAIDAMPALVARSIAEPRYRTMLISLFGVIAALLATIGVYGVTARAVSQQTREIGIRMALGAPGCAVICLFIWRTMAGVVAGAVVGLGGAFAASRLLAPYLFSVKPSDPLTFGTVLSLMVFVSAVASWLPAQVASRTNPAAVLRRGS